MPFDDPTTHLELTMIHEAQILENSGRNLALVEYAAYLRAVVMIGIAARVLMLALPPISALASYAICMLLVMLAAVVIAFSESVLVRLRWLRLPNLLSFAVVASMLACLVAALKG
jgi:formate hydrogenlyase subunit 4